MLQASRAAVDEARSLALRTVWWKRGDEMQRDGSLKEAAA
jgi:hypothetical protein